MRYTSMVGVWVGGEVWVFLIIFLLLQPDKQKRVLDAISVILAAGSGSA